MLQLQDDIEEGVPGIEVCIDVSRPLFLLSCQPLQKSISRVCRMSSSLWNLSPPLSLSRSASKSRRTRCHFTLELCHLTIAAVALDLLILEPGLRKRADVSICKVFMDGGYSIAFAAFCCCVIPYHSHYEGVNNNIAPHTIVSKQGATCCVFVYSRCICEV